MTMTIQKLTKALDELRGFPCSNIVAGQGVGTAVSLDFGRIIQKKTLETRRGSRELFTYETSIFVQDATWRLEDEKSVICSSAADDNTKNSAFMSGLRKLYQRRLIEARLCNTGLDLILTFEGELVLLVFSVAITSDSDAQNYSVFLKENIFTVGFDGTVNVFPRAIGCAEERSASSAWPG